MGTSISLPALLRRVSAMDDTSELVWQASLDIATSKRRISDAQLIRCIDALRSYSMAEHVPYSVVRSLIELMWYGIISRSRIPLDTRLKWVAELSKFGEHQRVRDAVAHFAQKEQYLPYSIVKVWVENGMRGGDSTKYAALTLLVGDHRYFRATRTADLCEYIEDASCKYRGDHGMFRLYAMLVLRMKHVTPRARVYPRGIEALAGALYAVGRYDAFFFNHLCEWTKKLSTHAQEAVRLRFTELLDQEMGQLDAYRKTLQTNLAPAP